MTTVSKPSNQDWYHQTPLGLEIPPLTRAMTDAFIEMFAFIGAVIQRTEARGVTQWDKERAAVEIARVYHTWQPHEQAFLAQAPYFWEQIRTKWPKMSPAEREATRTVWIENPGSFFQLPSQPQATQINTYLEEAGGKESETDRLLKEILDARKKEEEELMKTNPELALKAKLDNEQRNAEMMSNIMNMRHQTTKAIIGNFKA
jgi:hypothetical protein